MSPHLVTVVVATTLALRKRARPARRRAARAHHVTFAAWLRRWVRARRRRDSDEDSRGDDGRGGRA